MAIFTNKFFSKEGQKERVSNVVQTIKSAVTGKGVQANTSSTVVNKVLSTAASNPFAVASVATVAKLGVAKTVATAISNTKTVAVATVGAPIAASYVASKGVSSTAKSLGEAQSNVGQFTSNVYEAVKEPSKENLKSIYTENPVIAGAVTAAGAYIVGKGAVGALVTNKIIDDNSKTVTEVLPKETLTEGKIIPSTSSSSLVPITPETQIIGKSASSVSKTRRRTTKKAAPVSRINVNVINGSRLFKSVKYIY